MTTSIDTGISKRNLNDQQGGIAVFAVGAMFCVVLILFMSINVGNIWATKSQLEDAAKAMSEIILKDQLTNTTPNPTALVQQLDSDIQLQASLADVTYKLQFGYSLDGTSFIPLTTTSNPTPADFFIESGMNANTMPALSVQITSPILDMGDYFGLNGNLTGDNIAYTNPLLNTSTNTLGTCYCQEVCASSFMQPMCMIMCLMFSTMMDMMTSMLTLNPTSFLSAITCFFQNMIFTMQSMADTAWNAGEWAFNSVSTVVHLE